ncbi:MAG: acyl-CoA thioesterase [Polyangiaceae bacterium]|nr:acyl-CoA thioesterase [Polyangiaceae bacterium]
MRTTSIHPPADVPAYLTSRMPMRVRFCETDLMGIVHHANYLVYFEAGRVDWLHRRGVSYDLWAKQGVHLPVVETQLRYRKAAKFDDEIIVETTCSLVTRVTIRYDYRIVRGGDLLCDGHTLLACVGNDLMPTRIPPFIAEVLKSAESM